MSLDTGVTLTMSDLFTLFPTPVYRVALSRHAEFKKRMVPKILENFKKEPNKKAPWANLCHTWQLTLNEIDTKDLVYIQRDLDIAIDQYFSFLNIPPVKYEIAGWINVHDSTMYQEVHNHVPAMISGIYYVQFDKDKDNQVLFRNPNTCFDTMMTALDSPLGNPMLGLHSGCLDNFIIEEGDLILFPSTLEHLVPKSQQHDQLRITLSFNVTPIRVVK